MPRTPGLRFFERTGLFTVLDSLLDCHTSRGGPNLQPITTSGKGVYTILTLHDHAFEIQCFNLFKETLTAPANMVGVHRGKEDEFKARWEQMTVGSEKGLYREILTELDPEPPNPKFHTFSLGDPFYSTFINIGVWESVEHFDKAVGKYIPEAEFIEKEGRQKYLIELEAFEFKLRERIVLKVVSDRGGLLPAAQMKE